MNPGMRPGLIQTQSQIQTIAPRMIQSMEILQLPVLALQERIEQELQENPVLELQEFTPEADADSELEQEWHGSENTPDQAVDPDGVLTHDEDAQLDFNRLDALNREWDDAFDEEHRVSRAALDEEGDRKHDAMQNMPSRPQSLQEHLEEQLAFLDIPPRLGPLVEYLLSYIDWTGYLGERDEENRFFPVHLEDLAHRFPEAISLLDLEEALRLVQQLDPPGVGARDLRECLTLQLQLDTPYREVVRVLIYHHLDDIQHNRLPVIQKETDFDIDVIKEAIEIIRHLNPRPGSAFASESTHYVTPDVIVERDESGHYDIRLADEWTPNLHISPRYTHMAADRQGDPTTKNYLSKKIQAAKWLIDAIEQRRNTLLKVTRAIIDHQRAFLDQGPEHIEPLKMQQIADQVGVHVTTVSRAVDDKWVQTPRGVFPLKRFFGGGAKTTSGEEVAWETIKRKLLELIDQEDKGNPLSDEDLVTKLNEAGYPVARRTVTKYRKMLKIPSSRQRKVW